MDKINNYDFLNRIKTEKLTDSELLRIKQIALMEKKLSKKRALKNKVARTKKRIFSGGMALAIFLSGIGFSNLIDKNKIENIISDRNYTEEIDALKDPTAKLLSTQNSDFMLFNEYIELAAKHNKTKEDKTRIDELKKVLTPEKIDFLTLSVLKTDIADFSTPGDISGISIVDSSSRTSSNSFNGEFGITSGKDTWNNSSSMNADKETVKSHEILLSEDFYETFYGIANGSKTFKGALKNFNKALNYINKYDMVLDSQGNIKDYNNEEER